MLKLKPVDDEGLMSRQGLSKADYNERMRKFEKENLIKTMKQIKNAIDMADLLILRNLVQELATES